MTSNVHSEILGCFHDITAEVVYHHIWNVPSNALLLHLPEPQRTLSGLQGYRRVRVVANCHIPPPLWMKLHDASVDWRDYYRKILKANSCGRILSLDNATMLSTGVPMPELAFREETDGDLWAMAFVTAGVEGNALRVGVDTGRHHRPIGTINTIVFSSCELTQAAMAASFITITEAKVVALEDLGIKSTYNPALQATGTGTDQIVVVSGKTAKCTYVSGHTKIGGLMARAVTAATKEAIAKRRKALNS
ncbi:adenosylcobinamide amidohydrolase [Dehalogenimonas etheniformans]|uniref:Cobalamin biosynthesis protein CbiZ n=1 Tax=Dehalogenimonas etheniformans TaxID=1536648 RepID=A0A2P5P9F7_9CHLR|nr:adenosylcobinamide amidohydrolase [Dehalogenimonas etheniformans]PPD58914.1 cobalamin biosynthesis protein CbiZ [Dehalogenimonas etheniformans]QNT76320.1 adenosylcobinamide amidohydrolase [Dehalogenimonas etheniformans]